MLPRVCVRACACGCGSAVAVPDDHTAQRGDQVRRTACA